MSTLAFESTWSTQPPGFRLAHDESLCDANKKKPLLVVFAECRAAPRQPSTARAKQRSSLMAALLAALACAPAAFYTPPGPPTASALRGRPVRLGSGQCRQSEHELKDADDMELQTGWEYELVEQGVVDERTFRRDAYVGGRSTGFALTAAEHDTLETFLVRRHTLVSPRCVLSTVRGPTRGPPRSRYRMASNSALPLHAWQETYPPSCSAGGFYSFEYGVPDDIFG